MSYVPLQRRWDLDEVLPLAPLTPHISSEFPPGQGLSAEDDARVWQDLAAEYDARLLEAELARGAPRFSPEFQLFLATWAEDEARHTEALLRIYTEAAGVTEGEVKRRLEGRAGDFEPMAAFLDDEFRLAVLLAYDEAMSTHGYGADIPFYASLGHTPERQAAFAATLRVLKSDEAVHYRNAVELLSHRHPGRAAEVAPLR